jgi:hypothetical protein
MFVPSVSETTSDTLLAKPLPPIKPPTADGATAKKKALLKKRSSRQSATYET